MRGKGKKRKKIQFCYFEITCAGTKVNSFYLGMKFLLF